MVDTTFIYGLNDPETGECRYVGKADDPQKRLGYHLRSPEKCHRTNWLKSLTARGLKPLLEILDEVPVAEWQFWEKKYIFVSRAIGMRLVNGTDGGDGLCNPSFETRKKLGVRPGTKRTPETCAKISAAKTGKKLNLSPESLQKRIDYSTGRVHSDESRAKRRTKITGASSKLHGVSLHLQTSKWRARISIASKQAHLGLFSTEFEAARAYDAAAKIHHGEHAVLNFP